MYVLLDVRRFSMEHVVSFDVSHVYRAIREVYQVHLYVFFFFFFFSLCLSLYLLRSFSLQCGTSDYESWVFQWLIVITGNKIAIFYSNDSALQTLEFFFKANYVYRLIFFFFFFFHFDLLLFDHFIPQNCI